MLDLVSTMNLDVLACWRDNRIHRHLAVSTSLMLYFHVCKLIFSIILGPNCVRPKAVYQWVVMLPCSK